MGMHLTIDGWRSGRDTEGWKIHHYRLLSDKEGINELLSSPEESEEPQMVSIRPKLREDIKALKLLFGADTPPLRSIRSKKTITAYYGFGDASQSAFGATLGIENGTTYQYGQWCTKDPERSSN